MKLSANNFLTIIRQIVTGGGRDAAGACKHDSGFFRDIPIPLGALDLATTINYDGSESGAAVATLGGAWLTADESNARVVLVEQGIDTIGRLSFPVPRDYDEATDTIKVRVLASQLTVSTDDDVQFDSTAYVKTAGVGAGC